MGEDIITDFFSYCNKLQQKYEIDSVVYRIKRIHFRKKKPEDRNSRRDAVAAIRFSIFR